MLIALTYQIIYNWYYLSKNIDNTKYDYSNWYYLKIHLILINRVTATNNAYPNQKQVLMTGTTNHGVKQNSYGSEIANTIVVFIDLLIVDYKTQ